MDPISNLRTEQGLDQMSKVEACIKILEDLYGEPKAEKISPVDLLVITILSQNTSDANSLRAYGNLRRAYPYFETMMNVPANELADKIRVGGLSEKKARRIKDALARIQEDFGTITLEPLREMGLDEAKRYLLSIKGVGPKTASVVLLFAFGKPTLPVDTHVYRVSRRLGLVPEKASVEVAQRILERITPTGEYFSFHVNMIRHGRKACRARKPLHQECGLRDFCDCYLRGHKV
jgi:endonuclease III